MTQAAVAEQWWQSQYISVYTDYRLNEDEESQAIAALDQLRKQVDCRQVDLNDYDRIVLHGVDGLSLQTILRRKGNGATYRIGPSQVYCWRYRANRLYLHHKLAIAATITIATLTAIAFYTK